MSDESLRELREVQAFFRLPSVGLVEKDLHVVRAIAALAAIDVTPFDLVFGGGTALARAHRIVRRMSEDVDFKIVPRAAAPVSRSGLRRQLDRAARTGLGRTASGRLRLRSSQQVPRTGRATKAAMPSGSCLIRARAGQGRGCGQRSRSSSITRRSAGPFSCCPSARSWPRPPDANPKCRSWLASASSRRRRKNWSRSRVARRWRWPAPAGIRTPPSCATFTICT